MTKKELSITLSKLKIFSQPDLMKEQYPTDSDIAGDIVWTAFMNQDIENKTIADLGAGTGILGIGCLLLQPKKVYFVEKDITAIKVLKENLEFIGAKKGFEVINSDIKDFTTKVDIVIQNPPFGTKNKYADTIFLEKAMNIADVVYSFHKSETKTYIQKFVADKGWKLTHYFEYDFPLKKTMKQHKKKVEKIKVSCYRIKNTSS